MSWNILKKAITDVIKTNGNEEITGQNLQNTLLSMVNALGENASFAGFAYPSTMPGTPDGPVFFFATEPGIYANFEGIKVGENETAVLLNRYGQWEKYTLTTDAGGLNSDIKALKERNNAEIPVYSGVVESATIKSGSVTQYSGVYFIKSEGRFAAKQGSEYFANWLAYGGYQAQQVYHQDNKAVPNRLYNLIALFGGGLHYFDGTSFKVVNDNAGVEEAIMLLRSVMGGNAQVIEWSHTHNMNDYKDAGTYRIKGERTGDPLSDNLPIMNQGSGHTIEGILYVLDSSLTNGSGKEDDCTITQFLMLSNRVGGQEGDMYMRSAYGANKDSLTWKPWEKYQTNMEVGVVTEGNTMNPQNPTQVLKFDAGMVHLIENGIYSGVYLGSKTMIGTTGDPYTIVINDPTAIETFVMVVINNYAAASNSRCITQIKFSVTNGGVFSMEKRSTTPGGNTYQFSQWELINNNVDQQLDGYSTNAVANKAVYAQFFEHQEEINKRATKDNLKQGLDWEANTTKEFHIKNRTHHMKDYLCKYFTGSPIAISKPSDKGYVVIAYDTDGDAKYLKVEIKANEYKTEEFLDAMGLPIIFTWDNGASTINVQSFSGSLEKLCMRAYYSSSATSFDDYFVKLDEGFLPSGGGNGLPEGVSFDTQNGDKYYFGASDFTNLSIGSGVAVGREVRIGSDVNIGEGVHIDENILIERDGGQGIKIKYGNDNIIAIGTDGHDFNANIPIISLGKKIHISEGVCIGTGFNGDTSTAALKVQVNETGDKVVFSYNGKTAELQLT